MDLKREKLRLLVFLTSAFAVYLTQNLTFLLIEFFISLWTLFIFKVPLRFLQTALYGNIFLLFVVISLLLIDFEKYLTEAMAIFLKANAIFALTNALIIPMGVIRFAKVLNQLGVSSKLTLLLVLSYRYIHSLREEYGKMKKALACRGFEPKSNLRTYKIYGYLLGMLTVKTYLKAREVYKAMLCRGF
jgi:cobalt/nickel transport system permease protein